MLRADRQGAHDDNAAFTGADGKRADGPTALAVLAILAKYLAQPAGRLAQGIGYDDPEARFDAADVLHQVAWFKSQGMLPADAKAAEMIDRRHVAPLPAGSAAVGSTP